jgi:hypothetical protein
VLTYLGDVNREKPMEGGSTESRRRMECLDCGNTENSVRDDITGDIICLGRGGEGCGRIMEVDNLTVDFHQEQHSAVNDSLFSYEGNMRSRMTTTNSEMQNFLSRMNANVEKQLHKYGKDESTLSLTTSELFKNTQRDRVYKLIEEMEAACVIPNMMTTRLKHVFNVYRNKMTRIHKLNLVLASMFYLITLNKV